MNFSGSRGAIGRTTPSTSNPMYMSSSGLFLVGYLHLFIKHHTSIDFSPLGDYIKELYYLMTRGTGLGGWLAMKGSGGEGGTILSHSQKESHPLIKIRGYHMIGNNYFRWLWLPRWQYLQLRDLIQACGQTTDDVYGGLQSVYVIAAFLILLPDPYQHISIIASQRGDCHPMQISLN